MPRINVFFLCAALFLAGCTQSGDEQTIKDKTQAYIAAFQQKNAKALAQLWAENAVYTNPNTSATVQGREAIEKELTNNFQQPDNDTLQKATIDSILFPSSETATARGTAEFLDEDKSPYKANFQIDFAKQNGQWVIVSIELLEEEEAASHYDKMKDLEWLIGDWVDQDNDVSIVSSNRWDKNKNFILQNFTVAMLGRPALDETQTIGWDPANEVIRSWVFDSDGGFGQGEWKKEKGVWTIKATTTLSDGSIGSQVTTITPIDNNSFTLEITDREIDGELLPDIKPAKVIRKGVK